MTVSVPGSSDAYIDYELYSRVYQYTRRRHPRQRDQKLRMTSSPFPKPTYIHPIPGGYLLGSDEAPIHPPQQQASSRSIAVDLLIGSKSAKARDRRHLYQWFRSATATRSSPSAMCMIPIGTLVVRLPSRLAQESGQIRESSSRCGSTIRRGSSICSAILISQRWEIAAYFVLMNRVRLHL